LLVKVLGLAHLRGELAADLFKQLIETSSAGRHGTHAVARVHVARHDVDGTMIAQGC
jgi:hypothetical protein